MLRAALALSLAALASPAAALERPPLCQALHGLADAARASGQPQRVSVGAACQPGADTSAARAFCAAATDATAGVGPDALPWAVEKCVDDLLSQPQLTTAPGDVGPKHKPRLSHLAAGFGRGMRLDVAAAGDRYDVVVWAPK